MCLYPSVLNLLGKLLNDQLYLDNILKLLQQGHVGNSRMTI